MTPTDAFANALISAHQTGERVTIDAPGPTTAEEAYRIQARVAAALGAVAGFKTALKPRELPIMAPIMARHALPSGAEIALRDEIGIELEVGWKITAPLPDPEADDFDIAVLTCITPVPVIELVDTRLLGSIAQTPLAKLADFQINHGLIVGTPLTDWDGRDFSTVTAQMQTASSILLDGKAEVPGGSALASFKALACLIGDHCGGLRVGQIVITGSLHPLTYTSEKGEVRGRIDGLGAVSVILI